MKKTKKINMLGCILNILIMVVVVITIIGLYYMAQVKILNKDYANIFGYTFFEVATGSMANTINIGDIVVVKVNEAFKIIHGSPLILQTTNILLQLRYYTNKYA